MVDGERARPDGDRIDFVSIVTPNHVHFPVAKAFLEAGFHVVCDKPMTFTVDEARELRKIVRRSRRVFALTHNYTGYPMVKLARDLARGGDLGRLRKVVVEYPQGWLATRLERTGMKQAEWRTDPARSGGAGCMGDIGTHAENLADVRHRPPHRRALRRSDDLRPGGAASTTTATCWCASRRACAASLHASQVSVGEENALTLRVYGEKKGLGVGTRRTRTPSGSGRTTARSRSGRAARGYVAEKSPAAARATHLPAGHPEAFLGAFANVYRNAADTIRARLAGAEPDPLVGDFPTVDDGLRGMLFIEALLESAGSDRKWTRVAAR